MLSILKLKPALDQKGLRLHAIATFSPAVFRNSVETCPGSKGIATPDDRSLEPIVLNLLKPALDQKGLRQLLYTVKQHPLP